MGILYGRILATGGTPRVLGRISARCQRGTFLSMLAYKCQEVGKTLLKIGMFEPSSKTCSVCGYRKADLTMKDREWTCPDCGTTHDRDLNAATNIKQFALAGAG
jgi:putative transposase